MPECGLLAVGNELLSGEIRDLNLYTLSRHLTHMGFTVARAAIVRDAPESIADGMRFVLQHDPDVVICSGGLGPTEDDLTLRALAEVLGRELRHDPDARRMVETQYSRLLAQGYLNHRGPETARTKMAQLPDGATPLPNPVGTAPGVRLETNTAVVYVLPGVPAELEAIFTETVVPELHARFELGAWAESALRVRVEDEAEVAGALREVQQRHPDVYLKSLAQPFPGIREYHVSTAGRKAREKGLRIIATTQASSTEAAEEAVRGALDELRERLKKAGFEVTSE